MKKHIDMYWLLKPYEGCTIDTYNGKPNRLIEVNHDSVLGELRDSPEAVPCRFGEHLKLLSKMVESISTMRLQHLTEVRSLWGYCSNLPVLKKTRTYQERL